MSRDEALAEVIRDALRAGLDHQRDDPQAVDRVGSGVGVALGGPAADPGDDHRLTDDREAKPMTHRTSDGSDRPSR